MELIEKVGSYVGLLAFLGFAVLAFLYFSQARDVRRLRDWAGRAPERMAAAAQQLETDYEEHRQPGEAVGEEAQAVAEGAEVPQEEVEEGAPQPATPPPQPGGQPPAPAAQPEAPAYQTYQAGTSTSPLERVLPGAGVPGAGYPRRERRRRRRGLAGRMPEPRYLAIVGGGILLLAAGVFGATSLLGGDGGEEPSGRSAPVVPGEITVAVLNGTSVPGAAAQIGEDARQDGYNLGPVTNSSSSFDQSVIMFQAGREREARQVSRDVGIRNIREMTPEISGLAGPATVAIVVGQDRAAE
jgi:hypothetical protein